MKRELVKIIFLLLAIFPLWISIIGIAEGADLEAWKSHLNEELLKIEEFHAQIIEIVPTNTSLPEDVMSHNVDIGFQKINPRGTSVLSLRYTDEQNRLINLIHLPVRLHVEREVPVASQSLRRGQVIHQEHFDIQTVDASQLRRDPAQPQNMLGQVARTNIRSGNPIYSNQLEEKQVVERGDRVRIKVQTEGITISTVGVAQEAGSKGQTIRLVNTESSEEIYATVIGDQQAEIQL